MQQQLSRHQFKVARKTRLAVYATHNFYWAYSWRRYLRVKAKFCPVTQNFAEAADHAVSLAPGLQSQPRAPRKNEHGAPSTSPTATTMLARGSAAAVAVQNLVFLLVLLYVARVDSFVVRQAGMFRKFQQIACSRGVWRS